MIKNEKLISKLILRILGIYMFNFNIEKTGREFFVPNDREAIPAVIFTSSNRSRVDSKISGGQVWGAFQLMASNGFNNDFTNITYQNSYNDSWKYFFQEH